MSGLPQLRLLSRPGCHLCEAFEQALQQGYGGRIELQVQNVDDDAQLRARYGLRIPVLLDDEDSLICELRPDRQRIDAWLAAVARE